MKNIKRLPFLAMLLFAISCDKEEIKPVPEQEASVTQEPVLRNRNSSARVDPYPLDWENIDFMPTPSGFPAVVVPWGSGSSRQFAPEQAFDYRKSDGWELLYNTFNTTSLQDHWYVVLYNKYRGLVRMYLYLPGSTNLTPSANLAHTMKLQGTSATASPLMNFAGQDVVDVNSNARFASAIEHWQVGPGTWYIFEYEVAYDKNIVNYNSQSLYFEWPIKFNQIANVTLNGTLSGALTGTIQSPGVDFTLTSTISTGGQVIINGSSDADKVAPSLGSTIVSKIKNAITKGVGGLVEDAISGIFKRASASAPSENVNLKINTSISLSGQLAQSGLLNSVGFALSGYDQSNTTGFSPAYNEPLGVFYLHSRPTIKETAYITYQTDASGAAIPPRYQYIYEPVTSSISFAWNPALLAVANVQDFRYEVVVDDPNGSFPIVGKLETIGNRRYYTGYSIGTENQSGSVVGLRISFDVVPKDGNPRVTISKTFVPNMTYEQVITDPGEDQW